MYQLLPSPNVARTCMTPGDEVFEEKKKKKKKKRKSVNIKQLLPN